jgi:hypothetical protein
LLAPHLTHLSLLSLWCHILYFCSCLSLILKVFIRPVFLPNRGSLNLRRDIALKFEQSVSLYIIVQTLRVFG